MLQISQKMKILVAVEPTDLVGGSTAWCGCAESPSCKPTETFQRSSLCLRDRHGAALKVLLYYGNSRA